MFKFNGELVREAHKLTREIRAEYPEVDYRFQFGLNLRYLLSEIKGVEKKMDKVEMVQQELKKVCEEHGGLTEKTNTRIDNIEADFEEDMEDMGDVRTYTNMIDAKNVWEAYDILVNDFYNVKLRNVMVNKQWTYDFKLRKIFENIKF